MDLVRSYFDCLQDVEDYFYNDMVKINIEATDKVTESDIDLYFDSFFDAKSLSSFKLVLEKIAASIKKYRLKNSIENVNEGYELDYKFLETRIEKELKKFVRNNIPSSSSLKLNEIEEGEEAGDVVFSGYVGFERFDELVDLVLKMLPTLNTVAETYGLNSIQDVEFSTYRYLGLEDCFEKVEFTKISNPNVGKMCDKLIELKDGEDLCDILSTSYAKYTLCVLEAAYFVAMHYVNGESNYEAIEKHKDEEPRIKAMQEDLEYFLDCIDYYEKVDFVEIYNRVKNAVKEFDEEQFSSQLINELNESK